MTELTEIIEAKWPEALSKGDIKLIDRGDGVEIYTWSLTDKQPTIAEIMAMEPELAVEIQKKKDKRTKDTTLIDVKFDPAVNKLVYQLNNEWVVI